MLNSTPVRIVITGGPGSGKTEFFERLKTEKELDGFLFFEELARRILSENPAIRHHTAALHREIYQQQVSREEAAGSRSFITDRGTVDAFAFHPETMRDVGTHPETMRDVGTTLEREYSRYTAVIQLGSAAALGEQYYQRDKVRRESVVEAMEIENAVRNVWSRHPGYAFLPAHEDFEEKYNQFWRLIVRNVEA